MADNIQVLDRKSAAAYKPRGYAVLISIYDKSEPPLDPRPGWVDVLRLRFHDASPDIGGLEHFSLDHANQVLDFAQRHLKASDYFVVHCHHGRSRSAAIALSLASMFPATTAQAAGVTIDTSSCTCFNRFVYQMLGTQSCARIQSDQP